MSELNNNTLLVATIAKIRKILGISSQLHLVDLPRAIEKRIQEFEYNAFKSKRKLKKLERKANEHIPPSSSG